MAAKKCLSVSLFFQPHSVTKIRPLYGIDKAAALDVCARHPYDSIFIAQHLANTGFASVGVLGLFDNKHLTGLAWDTGTISAVGFDECGLDILSDFLIERGRSASSLVGERSQILPLWERLEHRWGHARQIRDMQYCMAMSQDSHLPMDEDVRPARLEEGSLVFPAAVAMFQEELGFDPSLLDNSYLMRSRFLIRHHRTYVKLGPDLFGHGERVIFKADVGALAGNVAQIQGVWTAPDMRGQGIATRALASVIHQVRHQHAAHVSLYVNHYNTAAVHIYEKLGFKRVSDWVTIQL